MEKVLIGLVSAAAVAIVFVLFAVSNHSGQVAAVEFDGTVKVTAEIAKTQAEQEKGLMGRKTLPEGMLFVFEKEDKYSFWMKDVSFELEAIWIGKNMTVVDLRTMRICGSDPTGCPPYTPAEPALYVLEVPSGFVRSKGVHIGSTVKITGLAQPPQTSPE